MSRYVGDHVMLFFSRWTEIANYFDDLRVMLSSSTRHRRKPWLLSKGQTTRNSSIRLSPWTLRLLGHRQRRGNRVEGVEGVWPRAGGRGVGVQGQTGRKTRQRMTEPPYERIEVMFYNDTRGWLLSLGGGWDISQTRSVPASPAIKACRHVRSKAIW